MKKKWYCYICGEFIKKTYYLISIGNNIDRVFLCCNKKKCIDRINTEDHIIKKVIEI